MNNNTELKKIKSRRILTFTLIGVIAMLLMWMNYKSYGKQCFENGDRLPLIQYKINNKLISLKPDTTEVNVLVLFKSECTYCEMTLKDIDQNIESYKKANFYFLNVQNINVANSLSIYKNILNNNYSTLGYLDNNLASDSLGLNVTPTIYVINQSGKLSSKIKGAVKFDVIDSAINRCGF